MNNYVQTWSVDGVNFCSLKSVESSVLSLRSSINMNLRVNGLNTNRSAKLYDE